MFDKYKQILTSEVLLQIDPPRRKGRKYYSIFLFILFGAFFGFIVYALLSTQADRTFVFAMALALIMVLIMVAFVWVRVRPTALIFTNKGITDSTFVSVFWEEIEFYNFSEFKDIGMREGKRILRLISNKPPLYHLRYMNLPRYFFDKGLFFSEIDTTKAEEIFRNKGITKEP